ncbi:MAG: hypothetical protein R2809_09780 [Flavobacteriales bacterium]
MKILKRTFVVGLVLSTLMMLFANYRVNNTMSGQVFASVEEVPINKVGLLLGTSNNAKNVETYGGFLTNLREKFARVKVLLDLLF